MTTLKTIDKAIDMLDCFTIEEPELSVTQLAGRLQIHKSIASRLASTMKGRQFLEVNAVSKKYRIGRRIFELGQIYLKRSSLNEIALSHLRGLVKKVGHASHLGVLDKSELLIACCVESNQILQVAVQAGARRQLFATAAGKLFLAFGDQEDFQKFVVNGKLPKIGPNTITSPVKFKKELSKVREDGIAFSREEGLRGAWAIAAPVFNSDEQIVASITTIFPIAVVDEAEIHKISDAVRSTAKNISHELRNHTL